MPGKPTFSSAWAMTTLSFSTTGETLMPRRESWNDQIGLPVRGWNAHTPPSPEPKTIAAWPASGVTDRRAVRRVFRRQLGSVEPDHFAGRFVEGHEAMGRPGQIAPVGRHRADDHFVVVDHRHIRPAAIGAEQTELLAQRTAPDRLARVAVEALKIAADAQGINPPGRRIGHAARPADALGRAHRTGRHRTCSPRFSRRSPASTQMTFSCSSFVSG